LAQDLRIDICCGDVHSLNFVSSPILDSHIDTHTVGIVNHVCVEGSATHDETRIKHTPPNAAVDFVGKY
jgi:hypothetical protein